MKKLLIPILTTAAIAPVATSMVACNSSSKIFDLEFAEVFGESKAFLLDNFKIDANKEYKFAADFSKVPNEVLDDWGEKALCFAGFIFVQEYIPTPVNIAKDKFNVTLNGKDITKSVPKPGEGEPLWIGEGHKWAKTDKVVVTITWTQSQKSALIGLMPLNF